MQLSGDSNSSPIIGPIRLAIVGCGGVVEFSHLPTLRRLSQNIEVIALADVDEHRLRRVGGMFDISRRFENVQTMLREAGPIDAIAICTPGNFHADAVIAALDAGKHVLVEKPLALTLVDADRIVAAVAAHPKQKLMLGFNLRHHRLVRQAKQMIDDGLLGEIHQMRTLWTSNTRPRMKLPAWRNRRASGGGVLSEIAVHHIDLARYLLGDEVMDAFAQCEHGEGDDHAASLILRMKNGATVSSVFSEMSSEANEIELIGSKGRLCFSLYRFDSLQFVSTTDHAGRATQMLRKFRQLPQAWPILRRGGDFQESYRQEWLAFADALQNNREPPANATDGRQALRAVLAAGASSNVDRPIAIVDAPSEPVAVSSRPIATTLPAVAEPSDRPQLSAILATLDNFESIRRTVRHLRAQTVQNKIELLIICPRKDDLNLDENEIQGFWSHRVIEIGPFRSVALPNAAGIRAAAAPVIVLCEDHAFPDPNWAQSLIIAHRGPYAVVGPAVHNANPTTLVSRADCLIGYGPWLEPIKPCEPGHLPGHNSAYKRDLLLEYGDRLEEMLEAESILQWELRGKGHRLYLDPTARLAHTNFARFGIWTKVQFHAGRVFAAIRSRSWPIWKRLLFTLGSPLIPIVRLKRIWSQSRRLSAAEGIGPGVLMMLLWGLALDGIGQMIGYLTGAGASSAIAHEFDRVHHITDQDLQQLPAAQRVNTASSSR